MTLANDSDNSHDYDQWPPAPSPGKKKTAKKTPRNKSFKDKSENIKEEEIQIFDTTEPEPEDTAEIENDE